jgi:CBS domain-containing protein
MPIGDISVRNVVTAPPETTIQDAARLMRINHTGDLLIAAEDSERGAPYGIVTDRDIVVAVVALGLDPAVLTVGDIMSQELETVREDAGVYETLRRMSAAGVRRMPVVTRQGALAGIVTLDDLVQLLAEEMAELARLISREQRKEAHVRVS